MKVPTRRLFLALWPDSVLREALASVQQDIADACGGRPVAPENFHLTLKFLAAVPQSRLAAVIGAARSVHAEPHDLVLDRVGYWRGSDVVWVGTNRVPAPLSRLVGNLDQVCEGLGFPAQEGHFRVHCTLFRKAGRDPAFVPRPILWPVRSFALVESVPTPYGARYQVLGEFPSA